MYSCRPLHRYEQRQDVQLEYTYSIPLPIPDVALKQWTKERGGEQRSEISVLMAWHDDADDTTNGWIFAPSSAWKNSIVAFIGVVRMFLGPCDLKSLNSIEGTQPRIMAASFNGNPRTTVVSCYTPTNYSDKSAIATFYDGLFFLAWNIL